MTICSPLPRTSGIRRCLASRLIGCSLTNDKGESVGTLEDLVLDSSHRRIAYAVVAFGGFLGIGSKRFAMPWQRLAFGDLAAGHGVSVSLDVTREELAAAPGFDKGHWPDFADLRWAALVEAHYRPGRAPEQLARFVAEAPARIDAGHGADRPATAEDVAHHRLSQLIGMDVVDERHEALASIEDLVVDVRRGTIDGVMLAFGGVLGVGERFVLLPADTLVLDVEEDVFVVASHRERLEIMAVPAGAWPALDSDEWLLGGRERLAMAKDVAEREPVAGASAAPEAAPTAPVPEITAAVAAEERAGGAIVTMGSSSQQSGGAPRLRLRIRSEDGREVVVLGGAVDDVDQEAFGLRHGHIIEVRGWRANQGTRSMLVARSITMGDRTLTLRDASPGEIRLPQ